jgi:hypothetical protein
MSNWAQATLPRERGRGEPLRATSYDEYTGSGWKTGDRDDTRVDGREFASTGDDIEFRTPASSRWCR